MDQPDNCPAAGWLAAAGRRQNFVSAGTPRRAGADAQSQPDPLFEWNKFLGLCLAGVRSALIEEPVNCPCDPPMINVQQTFMTLAERGRGRHPPADGGVAASRDNCPCFRSQGVLARARQFSCCRACLCYHPASDFPSTLVGMNEGFTSEAAGSLMQPPRPLPLGSDAGDSVCRRSTRARTSPACI